ncbi:MAG TPA: hypothetical protein VE078_08995 [Thermoanaerobaculia bacterium]|nr:hypothetical protein [Thermoanaerobaculia bacterium]
MPVSYQLETPDFSREKLNPLVAAQWLLLCGEEPEAQSVLRSWLDAGGDREVVREYLDHWLGLHGTLADSQFVMKAWLDSGGEPEFVKGYLTEWLKSYGGTPDAGFIFKSWLNAGGEREAVQPQMTRWLELHGLRLDASFVLGAWLDTGVKSKKLIEPFLLRWLAQHDGAYETSFVLCSWLVGGGEPLRIKHHVLSWLNNHSALADSEYLIHRWLQAAGDFEMVREPALARFRAQRNSAEVAFMTKFLARQPDLPSEIVRELLAWCQKFAWHKDAVSRLASLGAKLHRPELLDEVDTTCHAVAEELLRAPNPTAEQRALLVILFGQLSQGAALRARTSGLFLRWLRSPTAFRFQELGGRSASLAVQAQRADLVHYLLDGVGTGELSLAGDVEALRRFFEWMTVWPPSRRNKVRKLIQEKAAPETILPEEDEIPPEEVASDSIP